MRGLRNCSIGILLSLFASCNNEEAWDCFKTTGEEAAEIRELSLFNQIDIKDEIALVLVQDSAQFVEVVGGKNLLPKVITEIDNGVLSIRNENTCDPVRSFKRELIVKVHSPDIRKIYTESVKNITSEDTLFYPSLTLEVFNGVGVFEVLLKGNFSCYVHSGSLDINVSGHADSVYLYNAGLGFVDCKNLKTSYFHLNHNSTGDAHVFSNGQLIIENDGVGTVYYRGNPTSILVTHPANKNVVNEQE